MPGVQCPQKTPVFLGTKVFRELEIGEFVAFNGPLSLKWVAVHLIKDENSWLTNTQVVVT